MKNLSIPKKDSLLILIFINSVIYAGNTMAQTAIMNQQNTVIYESNFDNYSNGEYLAEESPDWTTWTNNPGTDEDAQISNTISSSSPHSVRVDGTTDLIYSFGDLTSGAYKVEFDFYIPSGFAGYYNLQHVFASEWAVEIYFHTDGSTKITAGGQEINLVTYNHNQWMHIVIDVNMDDDEAQMFIDDEMVIDWQWSLRTDGTTGVNQLACANFYAGTENGDSPLYYFDNFGFYELSSSLIPPTAEVDIDEMIVEIIDAEVETESFNLSNVGEQDLSYDVYPVYNIDEISGTTTSTIAHCGEYNSGVGYENAVSLKNAVLLTPSLLEGYIGTELNAIEFYINDEVEDFEVKVWAQGETTVPGPGEEIRSISFTPITQSWNSVELVDPIVLDGTPLWIGVAFYQPSGLFSMGCDDGPQVPGVNFRALGPGWSELPLDYNFSVRGIVKGDPITPFLSIPSETGIVLPGQTENIEVNFDPNNLEEGQYTGKIVIASNDPNENYDYIDYQFNLGSSASTSVVVNPGSQTVLTDVNFETSIDISNVVNLGSFELFIDFDPQYLQANNVDLGSFIGSTGRQVFPLINVINNNDGIIEYAVTTLGSGLPGPEGDGILLNIEWTSLNVDEIVTTDIIFQNIQITEPDGTIIPFSIQNGSVTINSCYPKDFDCDCDVDIIDVTMAAYAYGTKVGDPEYSAIYDLDFDGDVDIVDITKVTYDYGWGCGDKSESVMSFNDDFNHNVELIHQEFLKENETKELHINIKDVHQFGAYELEYAFDPKVIKIIAIEESEILSQSGRKSIEVKSEILEDEGRVKLAYASLGSKLKGVEGSGELVKIIYQKRQISAKNDFELINGQLARIDAEIIPFKSNYNLDNADNIQLEIIPNPNNGHFTLDCHIDRSGSYSISLISSTGEELPIAKNIAFEKGYQQFHISEMDLVPGIYLIKMINEDQTMITKKMIVQ